MRWHSGLVLFLLGVAIGVPTGARWFAPSDRVTSSTPDADQDRAHAAGQDGAVPDPARPPKAGVPDPASAFEAWLEQEPVHLKLVARGWPYDLTLFVLHDGPDTFAISEDGTEAFAIGARFPRTEPTSLPDDSRAANTGLHEIAFRADLERVLDLRAIARWLRHARSWDTWFDGERRGHARFRKLEGLVRGEVADIDVTARLDLAWNLLDLQIAVSRVSFLRGSARKNPSMDLDPWATPFSLDTVLQHPRDAGRHIVLEGVRGPVGPSTKRTTFDVTRAEGPPSEALLALRARHASR